MADRFYATRDKGGDDSVRIWCGKPDRKEFGSQVLWFSSLDTNIGLSIGRQGCSVVSHLFPDLLGMAPDSIREIAPPAIRFLD